MSQNILIKIAWILIVLMTCACSAKDETAELDSDPRSKLVSSVRIYLAKNSLSLVEFEQFSLKESSLFFECGTISRKQNLPAIQGLISLNEELNQNLQLSALETLGMAASRGEAVLGEIGDLKGFADAGQVHLKLDMVGGKEAFAKFSFNEVAQPQSELTEKLHSLISEIRSLVKDQKGDDYLCENESFFGIF